MKPVKPGNYKVQNVSVEAYYDGKDNEKNPGKEGELTWCVWIYVSGDFYVKYENGKFTIPEPFELNGQTSTSSQSLINEKSPMVAYKYFTPPLLKKLVDMLGLHGLVKQKMKKEAIKEKKLYNAVRMLVTNGVNAYSIRDINSGIILTLAKKIKTKECSLQEAKLHIEQIYENRRKINE